MQGYIEKKGRGGLLNSSAYRRRFFSIGEAGDRKGGYVLHYFAKQGGKLKGTIHLSDAIVAAPPDGVDGRRFAFTIRSKVTQPKRTFILACATDIDRQQWVRALVLCGCCTSTALPSLPLSPPSSDDDDDEADSPNVEGARPVVERIPSESAEGRSWNEEYQRILDGISDETILDEEGKHRRLSALSQSFVAAAARVGKLIIAEKALPASQRRCKPLKQRGLAGGQKFVVDGIFFKFAIDDKGLLGDDEHAHKVAGAELVALAALYRAGEGTKLRLPLMALVDYNGDRLIAVSVLPIRDSTLVYGSANGGRSIFDTDATFRSEIQAVTSKLNIAEHAVKDASGCTTPIAGPFDLEGHRGLDGRLYCLDFARLFPPEPPGRVPASFARNPALHRFIRPELVRGASAPLNPDAFLRISSDDAEGRALIEQTFAEMERVAGPRFAQWLEGGGVEDDQVEPARVEELFSTFLHHYGINVRHIGCVRSRLKSAHWRTVTLVEAITRTIKQEARARLRLVGALLRAQSRAVVSSQGGGSDRKVGSEAVYRQEVLAVLNGLFGAHSQAAIQWSHLRRQMVEHRFVGLLTDDECAVPTLHQLLTTTATSAATTWASKASSAATRTAPPFTCYNPYLRARVRTSLTAHVILRVVAALGVTLQTAIVDELLSNTAGFLSKPLPFADPRWVCDTDVRVKQLPVVSYCEGTAFLIEAARAGRHNHGNVKQDVRDLLQLSARKFDDALAFSLDDPSVLANYAFIHQLLGQPVEALKKLHRSIAANPFHVRSLYYEGITLERYCKPARFAEAEQAYRRAAVASNYTHANAMKDLGNICMHRLQKYEEAEDLYRRCIDVSVGRHARSLQNLALLLLQERDDGKLADVEEPFDLLVASMVAGGNLFESDSSRTYRKRASQYLQARAEILTERTTHSGPSPHLLRPWLVAEQRLDCSGRPGGCPHDRTFLEGQGLQPDMVEADLCLQLLFACYPACTSSGIYADFLTYIIGDPSCGLYFRRLAVEEAVRTRNRNTLLLRCELAEHYLYVSGDSQAAMASLAPSLLHSNNNNNNDDEYKSEDYHPQHMARAWLTLAEVAARGTHLADEREVERLVLAHLDAFSRLGPKVISKHLYSRAIVLCKDLLGLEHDVKEYESLGDNPTNNKNKNKNKNNSRRGRGGGGGGGEKKKTKRFHTSSNKSNNKPSKRAEATTLQDSLPYTHLTARALADADAERNERLRAIRLSNKTNVATVQRCLGDFAVQRSKSKCSPNGQTPRPCSNVSKGRTCRSCNGWGVFSCTCSASVGSLRLFHHPRPFSSPIDHPKRTTGRMLRRMWTVGRLSIGGLDMWMDDEGREKHRDNASAQTLRLTATPTKVPPPFQSSGERSDQEPYLASTISGLQYDKEEEEEKKDGDGYHTLAVTGYDETVEPLFHVSTGYAGLENLDSAMKKSGPGGGGGGGGCGVVKEEEEEEGQDLFAAYDAVVLPTADADSHYNAYETLK